jgi:hypothetical protein
VVEEISTLPKRSFFFWLRDSSFGPQRLQSPRVDMEALKRSAATLTPEQRERIRLGTVSIARPVEAPPSSESVVDPDPRVAPLQPQKRRRAPRLG